MTTAATASGSIGQRRGFRRGALAALIVCGLSLALPAPAAAMQLLEAVDHAELSAEVSATEVNRIALLGDRVLRVVRAPGGFAVEHDAATGDLWLRRHGAVPSDGKPVTLFVGTEKGFTYRLTLTPSARDAAQILIRNADAMPEATGVDDGNRTSASNPRIGVRGRPHITTLVKLVRAVARREAPPGYSIEAAATGVGDRFAVGMRLIETWRGPRFRALVFEAGRSALSGGDGAAGLAGTIGRVQSAGRLAALWLAAPGSGPKGGRLAVAIVDTAASGAPR